MTTGTTGSGGIFYMNCTTTSFSSTAGTASTVISYASTEITGTTAGYYWPRKILVPLPDHFSEEQSLAAARLVNVETNTGWRCDMIISGRIIITDPNIEVRSFANFLLLMKATASDDDRARIDAFAAANGV